MHPTLTEIVQHYLAKTAKRLDEPVSALSDGMSNLAISLNKRNLSDVLAGLLKSEGELIISKPIPEYNPIAAFERSELRVLKQGKTDEEFLQATAEILAGLTSTIDTLKNELGYVKDKLIRIEENL